MNFAQLVGDMGDFSDLQEHDAALKFWLPSPAMEAFNELCRLQGDTVNEAMRQFLAQHCYGVYAFAVMVSQHPDLFKDPDIKFSIADGDTDVPNPRKRIPTYWVPELGKNVIPLKIWLPQRMRSELQILADHAGIKLSQYVREIVISRLLGHGTLPYRPKMMKAEPSQSIEDWYDGQDPPMRKVDIDEYRKHPTGEIRMSQTLIGDD